MTRSPSARFLPNMTLVTDCRARRVSPRHPISPPRSRPLISSVIGSVPVRTVTCARTPMCLSNPSTSARAASALPFAGDAAPAGATPWSITTTSTNVSSGPSLITRTSTFRRLSPSSIKAASTASSRVRPRPSADLIARPPHRASLLSPFPSLPAPPGPGSRLRRRLEPGLGSVLRAASALRRDGQHRPTPISSRQEASPADHEVLKNDTDHVADKPVEPEPGWNLQGEEPDHHRRQPHHRPLHRLGLELLLRRVGRRWLLQHLRLDECRDRRQQGKHRVAEYRYRQSEADQVQNEYRVLRRAVIQVGHEQERRRGVGALGKALEHVVERCQDRDLDDQRQTADKPAERVDAVLLVELHHLRVQLLRFLLELLAQIGDLGRQLALLGHRLALRRELEIRERRQQRSDDDREDDDRHPVSADGLREWHRLEVHVQEVQEPRDRFLHRRAPQVHDGQENVEEGSQIDVRDSRWRSGGSRNRIVAALGERMAARDARRPHPAPSKPPVFLNCLVCVVRARRVVAARGRKELRKRMLVTADHGQQNRRHGLSFESLTAACSVSASRSANGTSSAAGRAIRTTSYRIPSPCSGESGPRSQSRATSRIRRRARLRSTEPLTLRLTVTPTRLSSASRGTANATSARPL